jgi:hypothetical protein
MRVRRIFSANVDGRVTRRPETCKLQPKRREIAGRRRVTTLVEIADHGDVDLRFPRQLKIDYQIRRSITGESGLEDRRMNVSADHRVGPGGKAGRSGSTGLNGAVPGPEMGSQRAQINHNV